MDIHHSNLPGRACLAVQDHPHIEWLHQVYDQGILSRRSRCPTSPPHQAAVGFAGDHNLAQVASDGNCAQNTHFASK